MATNLEKFMRGIRAVESSGDYEAIGPNNPGLGTGKGAYQYLDSTWNNYRGYSRADAAPKSVQDARARLDFTRFFKRYGRWDLVAIAHHAGEGTADKVKKDPSALNGVGDLNLSTKQYVAKVLGAAGLKRNSAGPGERGGGGDGGGRGGGGGLRRKPWALPRNVVGKGGRLTVDVNELYQLARGLTGHLAVLESVRRRAASVAEDLDRLALDDRGDARRIRRELDTALSDEYGVGRARNLLVRDIGYVVEARERALGADRTDRDHRRVVERLIASLGAESTTVATRRKIRRLLRGLYTERSSGGSGGSGGSRGPGGGSKPSDGIRDPEDVSKGTAWGGSKAPFTQLITPFMKKQGLSPGDMKRTYDTVDGPGMSDHFTGKKNAYAIDYPTFNGEAAARKLARALGIRNWRPNHFDSPIVTIGGRKFAVQILWGAGIDHADHVHVGLQRV